MALRQHSELIELQKAHLMQKKSLLGRRQATLNNLINIPGLSEELIVRDSDDMQKVRSPQGVDPTLFSPISSGHVSGDDVVVNDENNCFCQNNSTEIMSMIGKFNPQNNSICDECNKSSSLLAAGEITQHHPSTNIGTREVITLLQAQALTSAFTPSSQFNTRLTPMVSPKGAMDLKVQSFGSGPKRVHRQDKSQKKAFSPVFLEQQRSRRAQEAALSHNTHNISLYAHEATPKNLSAALHEYEKTLNRKSNERVKTPEQSSLEPVKSNNNAQEGESQHSNNEVEGIRKGYSQKAGGLPKQNSLTLSKASWREPLNNSSDSLQKDHPLNDTKVHDSPDGLQVRSSPSNMNFQQTSTLRPSNFVNELSVKPTPSEELKPGSIQIMPSLTGSNNLHGKSPQPVTINLTESSKCESNATIGSLVGSKITSPKHSQASLSSFSKLDTPAEKPSTKDHFPFTIAEEGTTSFPSQKSSPEQTGAKDSRLDALGDRILKHSIQGELRRGGTNMNEEDVLLVQKCLEIITNTLLETNGIFGHYTEKVVKSYQEKHSLPVDGVVTEQLWNRMKEDLEKRLKMTLNDKAREIKEIANKASEDKKILKEKQIKEAQESLHKIQAELIDLSKL